MRVHMTAVGQVRDAKIPQADSFWLMRDIIRAEAMTFDGDRVGNGGTLLVLLACPCCDRDVFDQNRDIPKDTSVIVCPIKEIDTQELESRGYKVFKITKPLPRIHDHASFLTRLTRGSSAITAENLDSEELSLFLQDWRMLLKRATDYPSN